ncbi:MAG: GldG family protein [Chloroflexi bacterium]|nr:GldG family protein [Chloroflexota bacterium]
MSTSPSSQPPEETSGTLASLLQRAVPTTIKGAVSAVLALGGLAALLLGGTLVLFLPELRSASYTVLALGGILLLVSLMLSFAAVRQSITGRRGRYSTNTAVMAVAFIALAVLVYVMGARNAARWDTTATKQFSLAPQTLSILDNLKEPILATALFVPGDTQQEPFRTPVENLLNEFRHRSKGKLDYRFVDPDLQPTLAKRYGVAQYPTVVVEAQESGRIYLLAQPLFQERDFTSALLITTGVGQKIVYFLTGHNERSTDDSDQTSRRGYGLAANEIASDNYGIRSLAFAETPAIPSDAAAIIIAGPQQDLPDADAQLLHDFLKGGGRLMVLLEPNTPPSFRAFLGKWGLKVNEGTIIDLGSSVAAQPQTPLIKKEQLFTNSDASRSIALPLDQTYFPGAAALEPIYKQEEMPDTIRLFPLARTTILSCITLDPNVNTCPGLAPAVFVPAIALQALAPINEKPAENAPREARLVVFGDADFATNFHVFSLSNRDLLLNSVNWLTEDISLAAVRAKAVKFPPLVVTGRQMQLIRALSWFVLPGIMAVLAGIAWWRRR